MGRRRQYESGAERQRAFRERLAEGWVQVDRRGWERLHERLEALQEAVVKAAAAGDKTAQACRAASVETVVEKLIRYFEGQGQSARMRAGEEGER